MSKIFIGPSLFFVADLMNLKKFALCHACESYILFGIFLMVSTSKVSFFIKFYGSISSNGNGSCCVGLLPEVEIQG